MSFTAAHKHHVYTKQTPDIIRLVQQAKTNDRPACFHSHDNLYQNRILSNHIVGVKKKIHQLLTQGAHYITRNITLQVSVRATPLGYNALVLKQNIIVNVLY